MRTSPASADVGVYGIGTGAMVELVVAVGLYLSHAGWISVNEPSLSWAYGFVVLNAVSVVIGLGIRRRQQVRGNPLVRIPTCPKCGEVMGVSWRCPIHGAAQGDDWWRKGS